MRTAARSVCMGSDVRNTRSRGECAPEPSAPRPSMLVTYGVACRRMRVRELDELTGPLLRRLRLTS